MLYIGFLIFELYKRLISNSQKLNIILIKYLSEYVTGKV